MSDKNKSEKLAAAKKRLKQFQAQSLAHTPVATTTASDITPSPADVVSPNPNQNGLTIYTVAPSTTPTPTATPREVEFIDVPSTPSSVDVDAAVANATAALQQALANAHSATQLERQRNESLATLVQQLKQQVHQQAASVAASSAPATAAAANAATIEHLQQQLAAHAQTIAVLVGEKSDVTANLSKFQSLAREKITEVEELQGRLNASRHRVQALERELSTVREASAAVELRQQRLCDELEQSHDRLRQFEQRIAEHTDVAAELRQQLTVSNEANASTLRQLEVLRNELALAQLKIVQLGGDCEGQQPAVAAAAKNAAKVDGTTTTSATTLADSLQHIEQLQLEMERLATERDQAGEQYQAYMQQLSADNARLDQQLQDCVEQNGQLVQREESLLKHLGELERQMQQQMAKRQAFAAGAAAEEAAKVVQANSGVGEATAELEARERKHLEQIAHQTAEIETLRQQQQLNVDNILQLETALERLQADRPDAKSLLDTMQGEKLAASRAVTQNVQLKQQLEELQQAFVQLSNDKLDLTERLQSEQYLGRENKHNADQRLEQMTDIKQKLHFKDEEMIRLSHECEERSKQLLQLQQEIDRMRHYEAKAQTNAIVQQRANDTVRRLQDQVAQLQQAGVKQTEEQRNGTTEAESKKALEPNEEHTSADERHTSECDFAVEVEADVSLVQAEIDYTPHIPTDEAMLKLQERFTRTMSEIADLTEEKNRLEHLVTQLQGETETIGEYIALYQCQRQQLKQREQEKDAQLQTIVQDREEMRLKLTQLNSLVSQLIGGGQQVARLDGTADGQQQANTNGGDQTPLSSGMQTPVDASSSSTSQQTAAQILHLLGEMQDRNQNKKLLNPTTITEVHQCACCYGKLETV